MDKCIYLYIYAQLPIVIISGLKLQIKLNF
jgi:hypothetical protein